MDRRQFMVGALTIAAASCLPAVPVATDLPGEPVDPRCGGVWRALYELDPRMRARVDLRAHSVELFTRKPHDDVVEVLWRWMPVGVLCLVNGRTVRYDRQMRRVMDTYA